ncbi:MAG: YfhO family protein [Dehalococcoidia bacterium]
METLPNRGLISGRRDVLSYDPLRLASAGRALAAAGDESIALARLGVGEVAGRGTLSRTRPIVSWASKAVVVTDEAGAFARLFDPALDDDTIVLTGRPPLPPPEGSPDTTRLEVVEARPGRYLIDIARDRPGFLRVLESAYPGWSAVVDGRPAALMTADGLFLGVPLSAGRHVVLLEYRPWSFAIGVAVSAAAWAVVGIALVRRLVAPGRAGPRL